MPYEPTDAGRWDIIPPAGAVDRYTPEDAMARCVCSDSECPEGDECPNCFGCAVQHFQQAAT